MVQIGIHPDLAKQIVSVAQERSVTTEVVVEEALRSYLRQAEQRQLWNEVEAFRSMFDELRQRYPDQFVAIYSGKLVDHDPDFQSLHRRIRQRFGRNPVLIRRVENSPERTLNFRSPRFG